MSIENYKNSKNEQIIERKINVYQNCVNDNLMHYWIEGRF